MESFRKNSLALRNACEASDVEQVKRLLSGNNDVWIDSTDSRKRSPLQLAVEAKNEAIIELLLDYNDRLNKKHRLLGNTTDIDRLLHLAARKGDVSVVRMLLQRGFDVTQRVKEKTPLWYAIEEGHADVVRLLLKHGANIQLSVLSWQAMEAAIRKGHPKVVEVLISFDNMSKSDRKLRNSSSLELAINSVRTRYLELKREQPSITQVEVERQFVAVMRLLFENGWNKYASGGTFVHPACLAIELNHLQILDLLVELGISIQPSSSNLVVSAAKSHSTEALKRLIEWDVCIERTNLSGATLANALNEVAAYCCALLLNEGADMYGIYMDVHRFRIEYDCFYVRDPEQFTAVTL